MVEGLLVVIIQGGSVDKRCDWHSHISWGEGKGCYSRRNGKGILGDTSLMLQVVLRKATTDQQLGLEGSSA